MNVNTGTRNREIGNILDGPSLGYKDEEEGPYELLVWEFTYSLTREP